MQSSGPRTGSSGRTLSASPVRALAQVRLGSAAGPVNEKESGLANDLGDETCFCGNCSSSRLLFPSDPLLAFVAAAAGTSEPKPGQGSMTRRTSVL